MQLLQKACNLLPLWPPHTAEIMKIYVSGPIKGFEETYVQRFEDASDTLTGFGHVVVNPVDVGSSLPGAPTYEEYMVADLRALLDCKAIYMLKGWERSAGARCEFHVAALCGLGVLYE